MTLVDSHKDNHHHLVTDEIGAPKDEVFVHSREFTWIVRFASTCWYSEPLLAAVVVRRTVIKVVKPTLLWGFTMSC